MKPQSDLKDNKVRKKKVRALKSNAEIKEKRSKIKNQIIDIEGEELASRRKVKVKQKKNKNRNGPKPSCF